MSLNCIRQLTVWLDNINLKIGNGLRWLCVAMMLISSSIVLLRYSFSIGSIALQESLGYIHGMFFMGGLGYALQTDSHVRVDPFYRRWSPRTQAWINCCGTLFFLLPFSGFIIFSSWNFVHAAWLVREASPNANGLPIVYLAKTLIPITGLLLFVQGIAELLKNTLTIVIRNND